MSSTAVSEMQGKLFKRIGIDVSLRPQATCKQSSQRSKILIRKLQRKAQRMKQSTQISSRCFVKSPIQESGPPPCEGRNQSIQKRTCMNTAHVRVTHDCGDGLKVLPEGGSIKAIIKRQTNPDACNNSSEDEERTFPQEDETDAPDEKLLEIPPADSPKRYNISHRFRKQLADDDAQIEELERKLGIKRGRISLPKAFKEDGLDEMLSHFVVSSENHDEGVSKRKRDFDDWLATKRRKTGVLKAVTGSLCHDLALDHHDTEAESNAWQEGEGHGPFTFNGEERAERPPGIKENPYVAPSIVSTIAKYIPPSLRLSSPSKSGIQTRLQRKIQGLVNRLTEANILSIVGALEELYQNNARGMITGTLTDTLIAQMHKSEAIPDQFLVLTGGFSAAIYKVVGSSFGSHLLHRVVQGFKDTYNQINEGTDIRAADRMVASNMLGFLTQLYLFDVVGSKIVFDYMAKLLTDLNEVNVELLLRICRMSGRLLRRDDPHALKHITTVLNDAIAKIGYSNISARTKFMVDMINDLRKSKAKARGIDSTTISDHVTRMRRRLAELRHQSRRLDGLAPLGVSLREIEGFPTQGKWWLVGASVLDKGPGKQPASASSTEHHIGGSDNEDMDLVLPDYASKARAQGLYTTVQISIFAAIMSAINYEHGYRQYLELGLKKENQLEIARVLVQCVGSESSYNEYYALVGKQACSSNKVRFAFQDRMWKIFRSLGESMFGVDTYDGTTAERERMQDERRISFVARFYASLIGSGSLGISILKPLNLLESNTLTSLFLQYLIISLLKLCRGEETKETARVRDVFGAAAEVPSLAASLHWFLRKEVRRSRLMNPEECKRLERVRQKAEETVQCQSAVEDQKWA